MDIEFFPAKKIQILNFQHPKVKSQNHRNNALPCPPGGVTKTRLGPNRVVADLKEMENLILWTFGDLLEDFWSIWPYIHVSTRAIKG